MSPPPPTPGSERDTAARPAIHTAAPKNCLIEYRVPRMIHVRIMAHGIVQQCHSVTLVVVDEYWCAFFTAYNIRRNINNSESPFLSP